MLLLVGTATRRLALPEAPQGGDRSGGSIDQTSGAYRAGVIQEIEGTEQRADLSPHSFRVTTITDLLNMSVEEAVRFFEAEPALGRKIQVLNDLGLGYLTFQRQSGNGRPNSGYGIVD